jgi:quinol monooxygenase YgiN
VLVLAISGCLRFPADQRDEMVGVLTALAERTRRDEGCIEYWWSEDLAEAGAFRFFEAWESEATFAAHRDASYEVDFNERYLTRIVGAEARQYEVVTVRPLTG